MKAVILAAGIGARLKPLTDRQPKVMIKIGNKPILEHLINLCSFHNLKDIIISTHYLPEKISAYFQDGKKFNVHLTYSHEKKMLGGAGALQLASALLKDDDFIVLNGDVLTNVNLTEMISFHHRRQGLAAFLVHNTDHPLDSDLVEYDDNNKILRFFRPQAGDNFQPISKSGTHIFKPSVLNFIPPQQEFSLEKQLIPALLTAHQPLYAYYSNCYSKDMGTLERLVQVRKDYQDGKIAF